MRKFLCLITDHDDPNRVGTIKVTDTPVETVVENEESLVRAVNTASNQQTTYTAVGLGHHDFEDEADYEAHIYDVIRTKLQAIDAQHLDNVDADVPGVTA